MHLLCPSVSAPLKAVAVVMELCFLVNNGLFLFLHSPAAETDGAEGKKKAEGRGCAAAQPLVSYEVHCASQTGIHPSKLISL